MELERSPRTECGSRGAGIVRTPENRGRAQLAGFDHAAIDDLRITAASGTASDPSLYPVEELADISNAPQRAPSSATLSHATLSQLRGPGADVIALREYGGSVCQGGRKDEARS